ncbi:Monothiol glutaredoxin-S7, chloroplastic [Hordeum vulgare]|nr:Monothiol glutaredoxin-S7, chloroplastic [Hordeum vulgare]
MGTALSQSDGNGNGVEVNAMPDLEIHHSTIINMLHSMVPCASPPAVAQLGRTLWGLGSLTLVFGLTTVLHLPAAGPVFAHYKAAYYTILAFVLFIAVPVELATAFCLPRCSDGCRLLGFARGLLPCAYVLLLVVISVGGFVPFKL